MDEDEVVVIQFENKIDFLVFYANYKFNELI